MSQARRCDACRRYYDEPTMLKSNVMDDKPAPFKLGKDKIPFRVSISLLPYRLVGENQNLPIDLCPACRYRCLLGLGENLIAGCKAALKTLRRGGKPAPEPEKAGPPKTPEKRESCPPTR